MDANPAGRFINRLIECYAKKKKLSTIAIFQFTPMHRVMQLYTSRHLSRLKFSNCQEIDSSLQALALSWQLGERSVRRKMFSAVFEVIGVFFFSILFCCLLEIAFDFNLVSPTTRTFAKSNHVSVVSSRLELTLMFKLLSFGLHSFTSHLHRASN